MMGLGTDSGNKLCLPELSMIHKRHVSAILQEAEMNI